MFVVGLKFETLFAMATNVCQILKHYCNHGANTSPVLSTHGNKFFVVEKLNSR